MNKDHNIDSLILIFKLRGIANTTLKGHNFVRNKTQMEMLRSYEQRLQSLRRKILNLEIKN